MRARRYVLLGLAAVSTAVLNAYFFSHSLMAGSSAAPKLAVGDACVDEKNTVASAENPNKVLFISCGGFLE